MLARDKKRVCKFVPCMLVKRGSRVGIRVALYFRCARRGLLRERLDLERREGRGIRLGPSGPKFLPPQVPDELPCADPPPGGSGSLPGV